MSEGLDFKQPSRLPDRIGPYRILSRLGRGAMGTVYCARDDRMDREVALKVMTADADGDETIRERFFREARITGRLRHRNIVTVLDMGEDGGRDFIVMELLRGRTLGDWLKERDAAPLEAKLDVMIQACEGLSVAHGAGVIHRDVKPSNLFVLEDGGLKILDFGVARLATSNMTRAGLIIGTPDYMSPEQACGYEIDTRSDIFSLAAVFYLMLTGRKPFEGADLPVVLHRVVHDDPLPIREHEAPAALAQIVMRALAKPLEQRYATLDEMAGDLIRYRHQLDSESRQLAALVERHYVELQRIVATISESRSSIGQASPVDSSRYQSLSKMSAAGRPALLALSRQQLTGLLATVQADARTAAEDLDHLETGIAALESAERAVSAGHGREALHHFARAAEALGSDLPRISAGEADARQIADDQQANADRIHALLTMARAEHQAGHLAVAADQLADILRLEPRHAGALALLAQVDAAVAAETDRKRKKFQRVWADMEQAISRGDFDHAERLLDAARAIDSTTETLRTGEQRLAAARVAAAARDEEARLAADVITRAEASFEDGTTDQALAALDEFVQAHPGIPSAAVELRRLRTRAADLAARAARQAEARQLASQADASWRRGDAHGAVAAATAALSRDSSNVLAQQIHSAASARLKALAEAAARKAQGHAFVDQAVRYLAVGSYGHAERLARQALDVDPDRADARGLIADLKRLTGTVESVRQLQREARDRERQLRTQMRAVHHALRAGDYPRAVWTAEEALTLVPNHAAAHELLARARAAAAALGQTHDDTVRMSTPAQGLRTAAGRHSAISRVRIRVELIASDINRWMRDVWQAWGPERWSRK